MATDLIIRHPDNQRTVDLSKLPAWFTLANPEETKTQIESDLNLTSDANKNRKALANLLFNMLVEAIKPDNSSTVQLLAPSVLQATALVKRGGARKSRRRNRRKNGRSRRR